MKDRTAHVLEAGFPQWIFYHYCLLAPLPLLAHTVYLLCKVNKKVNASKARTNISEYNAGSEE